MRTVSEHVAEAPTDRVSISTLEKQAEIPNKERRVFRLGRCSFTVNNCQEKFGDNLEALLPADDSGNSESTEIETGCSKDVVNVLITAAWLHRNISSVDGACLISPGGKTALIAGEHKSGRTSLAMALVLGHSWKLICERTVLMDVEKDMLIPFAAPFFVASGTAERIEQITGAKIKQYMPVWSPRKRLPSEQDSWHPSKNFVLSSEMPVCYDIAIYLQSYGDGGSANSSQIEKILPSKFLRRILGTSNLIWNPQAIKKMDDYLHNSDCYSINGGCLSDRLKFIVDQV